MFHPSVSDGLSDGPIRKDRVDSVTKDKRNNQINVLHPYKLEDGTWVYDDEDIPVYKEAFVLGSSELISHFVGEGDKCTILFSSSPIPQYTVKLRNIDNEMIEGEDRSMKGWYINDLTGAPNWLCGHLLDYFPDYPKEIYVKIQAK